MGTAEYNLSHITDPYVGYLAVFDCNKYSHIVSYSHHILYNNGLFDLAATAGLDFEFCYSYIYRDTKVAPLCEC